MLSLPLFLVLLGLGAAALAFWCDARLAARAPSEYGPAMGHVVSAIFVGSFLVRPLLQLAARIDSPDARVLAVLGIGLAALVYAFLAGIWLIRLTHALVARHSK